MKLGIIHNASNASRRLLALACAVVVLGGSARAAAPLRWKFKAGESLHYTMKQQTTRSIKPKKPAGREATSVMSQTVDLHWIVKSVSPQGDAVLTQTVDRVRTRIEDPGQPEPFEYDSDANEPPTDGPIAADLVPLLKTLVGAEFTFRMNARGDLSNIKVPDEIMESVRKANPGADADAFSDEGLKNLITQSGLVLPDAAVEKGKPWTQKSKVPLPIPGAIVMDKTFKVLGPDPARQGRVKIALESRVTLQPAAVSPVTMKIDSQSGKGAFVFDAERGRVVSSHVEDVLVMTLTDKSAGNQERVQSTKTVTEMKLATAPASAPE